MWRSEADYESGGMLDLIQLCSTATGPKLSSLAYQTSQVPGEEVSYRITSINILLERVHVPISKQCWKTFTASPRSPQITSPSFLLINLSRLGNLQAASRSLLCFSLSGLIFWSKPVKEMPSKIESKWQWTYTWRHIILALFLSVALFSLSISLFHPLSLNSILYHSDYPHNQLADDPYMHRPQEFGRLFFNRLVLLS